MRSIERKGRKFVVRHVSIVVALGVAGCSGSWNPPKPILTPFDESAFEPYSRSGTATITGQAFLKTRGGDVKFGAGNDVLLFPVTDYSSELYRRATVGGERVAAVDPRFSKYARMTKADASGNFEFKDLPAGNYYIECLIAWDVPLGRGTMKSGGAAHATVTVKEGETVKAVVTR